jgi:hypothetical protein
VGFVVDKVALGQVFFQYFGFPCQSSFHQLLHSHPHLSSGAGTVGQKWPKYKGLGPTPLSIKKYRQQDDLISLFFFESSPDEVIGFFSIDLILPAAVGPGVYSASNRNEYQELIK